MIINFLRCFQNSVSWNNLKFLPTPIHAFLEVTELNDHLNRFYSEVSELSDGSSGFKQHTFKKLTVLDFKRTNNFNFEKYEYFTHLN